MFHIGYLSCSTFSFTLSLSIALAIRLAHTSLLATRQGSGLEADWIWISGSI
jgi:hypothetical protein